MPSATNRTLHTARLALAGLVLAAAGCGGDDGRAGAVNMPERAPLRSGPFVLDYPGLERGLAAAGIEAAGRPAPQLAPLTKPMAESAKSYRTSAGTRFDVIRFADAGTALRAAQPLAERFPRATVLRLNVVAIIREPGSDAERLRRTLVALGEERT